MQFDQEMLQQITIDVCQSMLGLELLPLNPPIDTARQLVSSVEIRGARRAIVEVFAHDQLMASIAEAMFASDRGSLSQDEIRDAFCEIANMIGGNVKGTYGEESDLSLPSFGSADDSLDHLPIGCVRATFECCGHPLTIVLREVVENVEAAEVAAV